MNNTITTKQAASQITFRSFHQSDHDAFQGAESYPMPNRPARSPVIAETDTRIFVCAKQGVTIVIEGEEDTSRASCDAVCFQLVIAGNVRLHKLIARGAATLSPADLIAHGFTQIY